LSQRIFRVFEKKGFSKVEKERPVEKERVSRLSWFEFGI